MSALFGTDLILKSRVYLSMSLYAFNVLMSKLIWVLESGRKAADVSAYPLHHNFTVPNIVLVNYFLMDPSGS